MFASLRAEPGALVAYFPFLTSPGAVGGNARYMLDSTSNWRPMLNGYSGFIPGSFYEHARELREFPVPESLDYLRRLGVTHVVVDMERLSDPRLAILKQAQGLRLLGMDCCLHLYRLEPDRLRLGITAQPPPG
jgi:hypothetical protein